MKTFLSAAIFIFAIYNSSFCEDKQHTVLQVFNILEDGSHMEINVPKGGGIPRLEGEILWSNIEITELNQDNIVTVFKYPDGKHRMAVNLPYERNISKKDDQESASELKGAVELGVNPNPIKDHAHISFNLAKDCNIELFACDCNFQEKILFSGNWKQGQYDFSFNFTDFQRGLITIGLKVNGQITTIKVIKI